jgi:regulatory LuxR family protein
MTLTPSYSKHIADLIQNNHSGIKDEQGCLKFILNKMPGVAIQCIDSKCTICYWNQTSEALYGYPSTFSLGKRFDELLVNDASRLEFHESLQKAWQNKALSPLSYWLLKSASNEDLWMQGALIPYCKGEKVQEVFSIQMNPTAYHETEAISKIYNDSNSMKVRAKQRTEELSPANEKLRQKILKLTNNEKELLESNKIVKQKADRLSADLNKADEDLKNSKKELFQYKNDLEALNEELLETNKAVTVITRNMEKRTEEGKEKTAITIIEKILPALEQLQLVETNPSKISELDLISIYLRELSYSDTKCSSALNHLSASEVKVALMIKNGFSTKEVARQIGVSLYTIITHRKNIRKKLGINNSKINLENFLLSQLM